MTHHVRRKKKRTKYFFCFSWCRSSSGDALHLCALTPMCPVWLSAVHLSRQRPGVEPRTVRSQCHRSTHSATHARCSFEERNAHTAGAHPHVRRSAGPPPCTSGAAEGSRRRAELGQPNPLTSEMVPATIGMVRTTINMVAATILCQHFEMVPPTNQISLLTAKDDSRK